MFIPGFVTNHKKTTVRENAIGEFLNKCISEASDNEHNNTFIKDVTRHSLGVYELSTYYNETQKASVTLLAHNETNLGVIDIFVPNVSISSHRILQDFCYDKISIRKDLSDEFSSISSIFKTIHFVQRGTRRSIVFCYDDINKDSLLNLLVNEEKPMERIKSSHFQEIANNDIAQYDSAEVYAAETTMVEIMRDIPVDLENRIQFQALEIFFVELLLLQDAAISKLNQLIQYELSEERISPYRSNSRFAVDNLLEEWSSLSRFLDYNHFYFPTVRVSAANVANAFGINALMDKYKQNKMILEDIVERHNNTIEKENAYKTNMMLMIISIISTFAALYQIFIIVLGNASMLTSFYITLAVTALMSIIYYIIAKIGHKSPTNRKSNGL